MPSTRLRPPVLGRAGPHYMRLGGGPAAPSLLLAGWLAQSWREAQRGALPALSCAHGHVTHHALVPACICRGERAAAVRAVQDAAQHAASVTPATLPASTLG